MVLDHGQGPCPWIVLSDTGSAFALGAIGGTVWHGVKGFRNSPYGERGMGALTAIKMRAPALGGNFAAWRGIFSLADCSITGIRRKEDSWNAIGAGFVTGGTLAIRGGFRSARNGAIGTAVLLAIIEGVGIAFHKKMAASTRLEVPPASESPVKGELEL